VQGSTLSMAMADKEEASSLLVTGPEEATSSLLGKNDVQMLGTSHPNNVGDWQYVFVFPHSDKDEATKNKLEESMTMTEAEALLRKIFPKRFQLKDTVVEGRVQLPTALKEGMKRKEFHDLVFKEFTSILSGDQCGFKISTMNSFDEDETFLLVSLNEDSNIDEISDKEGFKTALKESAYTALGLFVPTDAALGNGEFELSYDKHESNIDKSQVSNAYPQYVPFDKSMNNQLTGLTEADKYRLTRRHIQSFVSLAALENSGVCTNIFPLHRWEGIEHMYSKGWSDPMRVIHWPGEAMSDQVHQYLGAELGFFFHWMNFFTRCLCMPALLSIPVFIVRRMNILDVDQKHYMSMGYAAMISVWSSFFVSKYRHCKNLKILKWGMKNFNSETAMVRKEFDDQYRGTWADFGQHLFHWSLCIFFVAETILFTGYLSNKRFLASEDLEGSTWGLSNPTFVSYGKYIITANIKIMDKIWSLVTDALTMKENWRTQQELKSALVTKIFAVKAFVFFYPFLYVIMIQPFTEGCDGDGDMQNCIETLQTSLITFFLTNFVTEIAMLGVTLIQVRMAIRSEEQNPKHEGKPYPYLEVQAKCPEYMIGDQITDFMNVVVNYGFVVMFGICLPFMTFLAFVTMIPMKRLLAYKLSYAYQRPDPRGAEGIGAWESIIFLLSYMGVTMNCYIAVFIFEPIASFETHSKFIIFILAEHVLICVKTVFEAALGEQSLQERRIEEYHEDTNETIMEARNAHIAGKMVIKKVCKPPASPYS